MYFYSLPLHRNGQAAGSLLLIYDTSYIDSRVLRTLRDSMLTALLQTTLITALALVLVRWTFMDPLKKTVQWLRHLRKGDGSTGHALPQGEFFDEIKVEVAHLARDLGVARAAAEEEARLRDTNATQWTADRLRVSLRSKLHDKTLFVVSNREPYIHMRGVKEIETIVPASGVGTALQPRLLAWDRTRIRQGSGTCYRESAHQNEHMPETPRHPSYTLPPGGLGT